MYQEAILNNPQLMVSSHPTVSPQPQDLVNNLQPLDSNRLTVNNHMDNQDLANNQDSHLNSTNLTLIRFTRGSDQVVQCLRMEHLNQEVSLSKFPFNNHKHSLNSRFNNSQ